MPDTPTGGTEATADDRERSPWEPDEVASLNAYQASGAFHPFTCSGGGGPHSDSENPGAVLLATTATGGWKCQVLSCGYTQDWAHAWTADWSWKRRERPARPSGLIPGSGRAGESRAVPSSLDLAAIAAYGAQMGYSGDEAAGYWHAESPDTRASWRAVADAVRMVMEMRTQHTGEFIGQREQEAMRRGYAEGAAAERDRIRALAERNGAVCTSDEGTSHYFADLITEPAP